MIKIHNSSNNIWTVQHLAGTIDHEQSPPARPVDTTDTRNSIHQPARPDTPIKLGQSDLIEHNSKPYTLHYQMFTTRKLNIDVIRAHYFKKYQPHLEHNIKSFKGT